MYQMKYNFLIILFFLTSASAERFEYYCTLVPSTDSSKYWADISTTYPYFVFPNSQYSYLTSPIDSTLKYNIELRDSNNDGLYHLYFQWKISDVDQTTLRLNDISYFPVPITINTGSHVHVIWINCPFLNTIKQNNRNFAWIIGILFSLPFLFIFKL